MKIQITFREKAADFPVSLEDGSSFDVAFEESFPMARASPYGGSYEVIPRINPQNLPTRDKHLAKRSSHDKGWNRSFAAKRVVWQRKHSKRRKPPGPALALTGFQGAAGSRDSLAHNGFPCCTTV